MGRVVNDPAALSRPRALSLAISALKHSHKPKLCRSTNQQVSGQDRTRSRNSLSGRHILLVTSRQRGQSGRYLNLNPPRDSVQSMRAGGARCVQRGAWSVVRMERGAGAKIIARISLSLRTALNLLGGGALQGCTAVVVNVR